MLRTFYNIYAAIFGKPELDEYDIKKAERYDKKYPTFTGKVKVRKPYSPSTLDPDEQIELNQQHIARMVKFVTRDFDVQCSYSDPVKLVVHFRGFRWDLEDAAEFCSQERFGNMAINDQPDPLNLADHYFWAE